MLPTLCAFLYLDQGDHCRTRARSSHTSPFIFLPLIPPMQGVKVYHLQDRKFKRPIADLRMRIACEAANRTPFVRACSDLFVKLVVDTLVETCYQASTCELFSSISCSDVGYTIRVHGFDHKLLRLASQILAVFFSFRDESEKLPAGIKDARFDACLEILMRNYHNGGMQASRFCTDIRLRSIRPTIWSSYAKVSGFKGSVNCLPSSSRGRRERYNILTYTDSIHPLHTLFV